jgi:hypothetical protein
MGTEDFGVGEAVGDVALAEQGIAEMALAEKPQSDHSAQLPIITEKATAESPEDDASDKGPTPLVANEEPETGQTIVWEAERVLAETALFNHVVALRSKGNVLETCPSQPSYPWSQVQDSTVFDPTLGEDVVFLSQCEVVSFSQAVPETPKRNVVIHGAEIVGPVACLSFTDEGMHRGSNRGGARVGLNTGDRILPSPSKQEDLDFFDKAHEPEHKETLWSLPGVYETLEEME